jgi:SAM-dependent methyltransferase
LPMGPPPPAPTLALMTEGATAMTPDRIAERRAVPGSAVVQGELWGARAVDWARLQEPRQRALYRTAFEALSLDSGTCLLDVGCGSGLALREAADRGADVTGLDASEALVDIARRRLPGIEVLVGELEDLPFADGAFDLVTGFNAFGYAARPVLALREAARVVRVGGCVLMMVSGLPEAIAAHGRAASLDVPARRRRYAVPPEGALSERIAEAGLEPVYETSVPCSFRYPSTEIAVRALLAAGVATRATRHMRLDAAAAAIREQLAPATADDGSVELWTTARYAVGERRSG